MSCWQSLDGIGMTEMTAVETSMEALEEGPTKSPEAEFDNGKEEPEED